MSASPGPVEWKGGPWPKGYKPPGSGRRKGEVYLSEAIRALLAGDPPRSDAPVWAVAANVLRSLVDQRLDSRILALVLERLEGKVPDRLEATINQGVVFVPAARLEVDAWTRLAAATLAPRDGAIDAAVVATARELAGREAEPAAPEELPEDGRL